MDCLRKYLNWLAEKDEELGLICNYCGGDVIMAIGVCEDCGGNNDDWENE